MMHDDDNGGDPPGKTDWVASMQASAAGAKAEFTAILGLSETIDLIEGALKAHGIQDAGLKSVDAATAVQQYAINLVAFSSDKIDFDPESKKAMHDDVRLKLISNLSGKSVPEVMGLKPPEKKLADVPEAEREAYMKEGFNKVFDALKAPNQDPALEPYVKAAQDIMFEVESRLAPHLVNDMAAVSRT